MQGLRKALARRARMLRVALAFGSAAVALTACGSSGSGSGSSAGIRASSAAAARGLSAARAVVQKYSQRPTRLTITKHISRPVPTGKHIVWIECGVPACEQQAGYFKQAATALGWTVSTIATAGTPESVQAAWKQAVRSRPDGVAATGFDRDVFERQLDALRSAGIPVVECCVTDAARDGIIANYDDPNYERLVGRIQAAAVTAAANGTPHDLYVDVPGFEILHPTKASFQAHFKQYAPDGSLDIMSVAIPDIGKDVPDKIVNYLRSHQDINTVSLSQGVLGLGLPAALRTAGLADRVKVVSATPSVENLQYIATGGQYGTTTFALQEAVWMMADALARHFAGEPAIKADLPVMYVTKHNLVSASELFPAIDNYQAQFKQLWGKG